MQELILPAMVFLATFGSQAEAPVDRTCDASSMSFSKPVDR